jgi:4-coumarate--CoA ligase
MFAPPVMLAMVKSPVVDEFDLCDLALRSVMTGARVGAPRRVPEVPLCAVEGAYGLTELHHAQSLTHAPAASDPWQGPAQVAEKNSVGFILHKLEVKFVDPDTGRGHCLRTRRGALRPEAGRDSGVQGGDGAHHRLHTGDIGYTSTMMATSSSSTGSRSSSVVMLKSNGTLYFVLRLLGYSC